MSESDAGGSTLDETIARLLTERGPLSVTELVDAVRESGHDLGSDAEDELLDELYESLGEDFAPLAGGQWAHLPTLIMDRVFTHRLSHPEILHDVLTITPDLVLIITLPADSDLLRLVDGGALTIAYPRWLETALVDDDRPADALDEFGSLLLPPGTLAGLSAREGDVVSLTITARGIELIRVDESAVHAHPDDVRQRWPEIVAGDKPTELEAAVLSVCADVGEAFRAPHPPLTELFVEVGVARNGEWVASADFDFADYWATVRAVAAAKKYGIRRDEARAVSALSTVHRQLSDLFDTVYRTLTPDLRATRAKVMPELERVLAGGPPTGTALTGRTVESMVPLLARPEVASALLRETIDRGDSGAEALALMAESLEEQATSRAIRPALRWLRAKSYEFLGRISEAEACLQAAERLDPSWPLTLLDLARYASDRGDAPRGLALLARAAPYVDADLEQLLRAFQPEPGPALGRNEPCWCGSGRKFKQCHLNKTILQPLEERAAWLYQKAGRFLSDGPWNSDIATAARERAAYAEDDRGVDAAVTHPMVTDSVLFEGGAFDEFLEQRGFLLPEDEQWLAGRWLLADRSVFDVTAVRRGAGFTARDLRSGDTHDVRERTASRSLKPGDLICARIVPDGKTRQVFGGIEPVALHDRDALLDLLELEPDPAELVAFLSRRLAPPRLVNTEGDPLVIRDVVLVASSPHALSAALDRTYRRTEGTDQREWMLERLIEGFDRICATLRLTGSDLHVNTNSDRRMDDVLATIRELDPEAVVISDHREPITSTRDAARLAQELPSTGSGDGTGLISPEDLAPEVQEALAEHMRKYEQQWLDLAIPALHGLTPREAAEDPTRRDDLKRLLASFEDDEDNPMAMSPRRLMTALGLEPSS